MLTTVGRILCLASLAFVLGSLPARSEVTTLVIDDVEMAGISGFRPYWDRPVPLAEDGATRMIDHGMHGRGMAADWSTDKPGALAFDAVHRSMLVRFPSAADKVAEEIRKGNRIEKVEVAFAFVGTECHPMDYMLPAGMSFLGDLWVRVQPRWHAVAWPLRRPWKADRQRGPTFNAHVNGVSYWEKFGAQSESVDRYPSRFGPTEISEKVTENRMDITPMVRDEVFGNSIGERLRRLAEQGLLVRKWETYDALFNHGGYEYGGAPGGRGILIRAPKLLVSLAPGTSDLGEMPPPANLSQVPKSGKPTAVMPNEKDVLDLIDRFRIRQPADMPLWQWERVNDLLRLSHSTDIGFPTTPDAYVQWVDHYNSLPYRQFRGHHTILTTHTFLLYAEAMPEAVRDHMRKYWEAWLMPGRPYYELEHNQWGIWTKPENNYYARTGDWRGNHSFYRESYCRFMSTMNFNHLAASAALFGGNIIQDPESMKDGRYGLEHWLLRLWSWYDGTTQESIDHYYLGLSLLNQKAFIDLSPTRFDRLMGTSILTKTIDELASCYHPALRRFISTSGRTGIAYLLAINEGPSFILHTLSRKGAIHDLRNPDSLGMPVAGHDLPPDIVAQQQLIGPWAPLWMGNIIDEKPFPFEMTATFKQWGAYRTQPLWKRSYLGRHYGLASLDVATGNQTVPLMAQWRRTPDAADNVQDVGTLLMRYGINRTEFYDSLYHGTTTSNANGSVGTQGGSLTSLQYRNKVIALTSPYPELNYPGGRPIPDQVTSLQSSIALANYQKSPVWRIFIDGKPMGPLPCKARMSSRITIQDGVSYVGIIPVPSTDLGRTEEIVITDGGAPVPMQGGGQAAPTLVIHNYNFYDEKIPLDKPKADWKKIDRAYGGFAIEMSDVSEYPSFGSFQDHIQQAKLDLRWDDAAAVLHLTYASGEDTAELGFRPEYGGSWDKLISPDQCFPYRRVNGAWPYLPEGLERDSTVSQQGRTGRLEKNGAALTFQPGRMGYLLTEPRSGTYRFSSPLPDPQYLVMDAPGGVRIKADGKLSLIHVTAHPETNRIEVNYAVREEEAPSPVAPKDPDMATALFVFGLKGRPDVVRNGEPASDLRLVEVDRTAVWVVPLLSESPYRATEAIVRRYENSAMAQLSALSALSSLRARMRYLPGQEHYLLTEPRSGAVAFTRMWPMVSPIEATTPDGVIVATDGQLALQRITVSKRDNRVEIDYAPYLQKTREGQPLERRATALLIFGMDRPPSALLHGKEYTGKVESVTIGGRNAYLVPLFGDDPAKVKDGIEKRHAEAMAQLPPMED